MGLPEYLVVAAIVIGFYTSFMGGANDFANSFGTSVGSGAITLKEAVIIAAVAELAGAVLVGGHVTDTVRKGIVRPELFSDSTPILAYGLLAAMVGSGLFLQVATWFGLPVSTTHSIVGAMIGFGLVAGGMEAVKWSKIGSITASWVISPLGGGIAAYLVFHLLQKLILRGHRPLEAARKFIPVVVGVTIATVVLSFIYKGLKNLDLDFPLPQALALAVGVGMAGGLATWFLSKPETVERDRREQLLAVESKFKFLQIFTAGYVAFAHGANDVANGIGPLAGIWSIHRAGLAGLSEQVDIWVLALGGTGLVVGLALFGGRVIQTVGSRITSMTPSRGFSAEFSTATVVLVFSKLGMPVSTTHTIVGAVVGVGLARGVDALDLRVIRNILASWLFTIPGAAVAAGLAYVFMAAVKGI